MIKIGENPEDTPGINKFIGPDGDGFRGKIIAIARNKKFAIIIAQNSGTKVEWGNLYFIEEVKEDEWPRVIKPVINIPNKLGWRIV